MAFQRTDYVSLNRGGTPGTPGGVTGSYYTDTITNLERLVGIPRQSALGSAPVSPGPMLYINDTVSPDALMLWDASASAYIAYGVTPVAATDVIAGIVELATTAEATAGTDTTRAVTPAGVAAVIAAVVASSPAALDTLNELAAALGNDSNFAATTATALGNRALTTTTISAAGLATGGGDLSANRTITVAASSNAQGVTGTDTTTAMTPASTAAAIEARFALWMAASAAP